MKNKLILLGLLIISGLIMQSSALTTSNITPILVIGGTQGSSNGQFDEPDSVYVDDLGTIYAGDTVNLRVQIFSDDGTYKGELTGFTTGVVGNEVQGISEISTGEIVVVEKAGNVFFFDKETGDLNQKVPLNITSDVDTQGLAVDHQTDLIYISNQPENKIYIMDKDRNIVGNFSTGQFTTPENIVIDHSRGRIYVSTEGLSSITYFDLNNYTKLGEFGKDVVTFNFEGLALDPLGNIIAVDEGPDGPINGKPSRFIVFDPNNFTALLAVGDDISGSNEGQFISPDGIAYDFYNNRVVIADQGNYRLQVFDYLKIAKSFGLYQDTKAPEVSDLADQTVNINDPVTLSWTMTEDQPFGGNYTLSMDNNVLSSGKFNENYKLDYTVDTSKEGTYTFTLTVYDAFGNKAEDTVTITVQPVIELTSSTTSTTKATPVPILPIFSAFVIGYAIKKYIK